MNKSIFYIPCYPKKTDLYKIIEEIKNSVTFCDKNNFKEAYFGEHLADKYEKITSSLNIISAISTITKKIKLASLTTNLTFYHPSVLASHLSLIDNLCKGRLVLGIGSGSNISDVESLNLIKDDNRSKMYEILSLIKKLLKSKNLVNLKSKNFKISTKKRGNKSLGLGFYNPLYRERNNLELVLPALNPNSNNVKIASKNSWSIVISNFCSDDVVKNHIDNYLFHSPLSKKNALKKIQLARFIHVSDDKKNLDNLFKKKSPHMGVLNTIHKKLKYFKRLDCFGNLKNMSVNKIAKELFIYGNKKEVSNEMKSMTRKYGNFGSLVYVHVPNTGNKFFDESLRLFSQCK
jgi:hypothetical protein